MRVPQKQLGFTLIETIVALVLIASTGMALFSWINSNIITLNRVQEQNAKNAATLNALEYIRIINPMKLPQGQATLGAYKLTWQATLLIDPRDGAGYPTGNSLYQLALYQTKVDVKKADGQHWFSFDVQQVGYKQIRDSVSPL